MRASIEKVLREYHEIRLRKEPTSRHPMKIFIEKDIRALIEKVVSVSGLDYHITGSAGHGNWATIPWIGIRDNRVATDFLSGVYIVYLFAADGSAAFLTLAQGNTDVERQYGKKNGAKVLRYRASVVQSVLGSKVNFETASAASTPEKYCDGVIYCKEYKRGAVPSNTVLEQDLKDIIAVYKQYIELANIKQIVFNDDSALNSLSSSVIASQKQIAIDYQQNLRSPNETDSAIEDAKNLPDYTDSQYSEKTAIDAIKDYISLRGFSYTDNLIENFYLSLKSKPFVILAGTSGTGKTRLVKLFSEAINAEYKMVPVRPDWSDSSDLFGHVDLNGKFVPGAIIDFVLNASQDQSRPYILCLDEMNLARVEYYLSDVLSVIETRDRSGDGIVTDALIPESYYGKDDEAKARYGALMLPENLYIVGTVNMDETTFPFSKKVLDRANTIEFSYVDLAVDDLSSRSVESAPLNQSNAFLKAEYLLLRDCASETDAVKGYCEALQALNAILQKANAHVGYRVRDEIVFYLLNNKRTELLDEAEAFDNEILQKVLPRIQGSSSAVKTMLVELFGYCVGNQVGMQSGSNDTYEQMSKVLSNPTVKYPKSAEKIAFMVRRFEEDGFTAYWL